MKQQDEIAKVAYELYERNGRRDGHSLDNWFEAEKIVMSRYKATVADKPKAVPTRKRKE